LYKSENTITERLSAENTSSKAHAARIWMELGMGLVWLRQTVMARQTSPGHSSGVFKVWKIF